MICDSVSKTRNLSLGWIGYQLSRYNRAARLHRAADHGKARSSDSNSNALVVGFLKKPFQVGVTCAETRHKSVR
jgi:hypothetical protein